MLDIVSQGFKKARESLTGKTVLDASALEAPMESIRQSLLEADVEYSVVKGFIDRVNTKAIGQQVDLKAGTGAGKVSVSAADHFVKICKDELQALMEHEQTGLKLVKNRPTVIMMVGLQGVGKTTTTAKLANLLARDKKAKPLLVAADMYRPAAVDQLQVLGKKLDMPVFNLPNETPQEICSQALPKAFELGRDVVLLDTAGRLAIDQELMAELEAIKKMTNPDEILLVVDAMMGQDAVQTAAKFHEALGITGFVMTKLDGDARGGAALSIKEVTGKPIKYLGMGEDIQNLEEFRAEGLASRILGMGDVVGLMQDFERVSKGDEEEKALKMLQGQFNFKDFYEQISMIQGMGSLKDLMGKMPIKLPAGANVDEKELGRVKSIIDSMTEDERIKPALMNNSRIKRIAKGSGRSPKDVQGMVEKFKGMRKMMGGLGKSMGLMSKIPGMRGLSQLNQMRKMAKAMQGGGGMGSMGDMAGLASGGMPDLSSLMGGGMPGGALKVKKPVDKDRLKKARKAARKARKKGRKK